MHPKLNHVDVSYVNKVTNRISGVNSYKSTENYSISKQFNPDGTITIIVENILIENSETNSTLNINYTKIGKYNDLVTRIRSCIQERYQRFNHRNSGQRHLLSNVIHLKEKRIAIHNLRSSTNGTSFHFII